jgi:hypothetical protein
MADTIIDGTLLNVNNIKYSAPKANASGGKSISVLNKLSNSGLRISTPLMLTWGASDFVDDSGKGNGKFELSLQFPNDPEDKNDETNALLKNMVDFENKIKADALKFSKEWFGKVHKSSDVVDALWTPMLKYSRDKNTGEPNLSKAPVLRVKLPQWEGVWKSEIYDEDGCKLFPDSNSSVTPLDFIKKGTQVATIIQCGGLWFANGKFGMTWKLAQAVVQKPRANIIGQCFIKLKKSDKDKLKSQPAIEEEPDDVATTAIVEDSDEEEEEVVAAAVVQVAVLEPEPVVFQAVAVAVAAAAVQLEPLVVKKKIVKKKTDA